MKMQLEIQKVDGDYFLIAIGPNVPTVVKSLPELLVFVYEHFKM